MSPTAVPPDSTRKPVFYRIMTRLMWTLLAIFVVMAVLLAFGAKEIDQSGGWEWLLFAALFIALCALTFALSAIAAAVSLWRGEPHRNRAIAFLVISCLIVWISKDIAIGVAGGIYQTYKDATERKARHDAANPAPAKLPAAVAAAPVKTLDAALLNHFSQRGFVFTAVPADGGRVEWLIANIKAGKGCDVLTSFVQFPEGASSDAMQTLIMKINAASVINEHERLVMFYPHARHNERDGNNCDGWMAKSQEITNPLIDAFKSYNQPAVAVTPAADR